MCYDDNDFAERLDGYMKKAGLSDETLAEQMRMSKMAIYNWRTGKTISPVRNNVLKCADILKLTPKQRADFLRAAGHVPEQAQASWPLIPVVGVPIVLPCQFFGRTHVLNQIHCAWDKPLPESIAIIGPKRSGKTSLLNYLIHISGASQLRADQPKGWPSGWLPRAFQLVRVDFQEANMHQPETLMRDVLRQLNLNAPALCDLACFSNRLKELSQPTVILMDDIEAGLAAPALDAEFWWNLRALGSQGVLSFVVMAASQPIQWARDYGKPSPFFNLFGHSFSIEAFTENEARELLAHSPSPFSSEEIDEMLFKSGCWPEPLQKLCDARLQTLLLG
ncbi:MAG TPA: helix-turn-helix domain-containing protein [Thiotrichaceae bacterium]|nr:helix-turn-helix domain-containing protein [Thiotrichaceae bacterium]